VSIELYLISEKTVYLYDSLQPKSINITIAEQLRALYGDQIVKVPQIQLQKGSKDCGCFAIAFWVIPCQINMKLT